MKSTFNAESPCIKLCTIDENGMCIGCFRTLNEIGNWLRYTDKQKHEINENLKERIDGIFSS